MIRNLTRKHLSRYFLCHSLPFFLFNRYSINSPSNLHPSKCHTSSGSRQSSRIHSLLLRGETVHSSHSLIWPVWFEKEFASHQVVLFCLLSYRSWSRINQFEMNPNKKRWKNQLILTKRPILTVFRKHFVKAREPVITTGDCYQISAFLVICSCTFEPAQQILFPQPYTHYCNQEERHACFIVASICCYATCSWHMSHVMFLPFLSLLASVPYQRGIRSKIS